MCKAALTAALSRATRLQAGIGYWTIDPALLGPDLVRALQRRARLRLRGPAPAHGSRRAGRHGEAGRTRARLLRRHPDLHRSGPEGAARLLHAKMLLFWAKDGTAELWVGSHNWTKRAILGLNVEASLVVRLKDSSPLFAAAADYLAHMKGIAEPFDVAKVDFYKALQRKMTSGLTPVMELEAEDGASASDTTITVFGTDRKDLTQAGHRAPRDPRRAARPADRRAVPVPGDDPALRAVGGLRRRGRRHLVLAAAVRLSEGTAVPDVAAVRPGRSRRC